MAPITEGAALPEMRELLERRGFRIRSSTRADCAYCPGRSRGTVTFTDTLAFCHRCHWKANRIGLAWQLGLLRASRETLRRLHEEASHRRGIESILTAFESWRDVRLRQVGDRYRQLGRQAVLAQQVLQRWPECETAWDALARFYHAEAKLCAALDWLTFAKASMWLERDSTAAEVFQLWREKRVYRVLAELPADDPVRMRFASDAQELFFAWFSDLEQRIRGDSGLAPFFVAHLAKYRSLMPTLAGLFELADRAATGEGLSKGIAISLEHTRQAAALCDYLEAHIRRVYACVISPETRSARELARHIKCADLPSRFTTRTAYLKGLDWPRYSRAG